MGIGVGLLPTGCQKDVYEFRPYAPVAEDLQALLQQVSEPDGDLTFRFEGKGAPLADTMLSMSSGVRLFLEDTEALFEKEDGTPVPCSTCPDLALRAQFINRRGEAAARQLSQVTYPDGVVMESAGVLLVRVDCAGRPLRLRPGRTIRVQVPVSTPKNNMMVFSAQEDADGRILGWRGGITPALPTLWPIPIGGSPGQLQAGYEFNLAQLGWHSCARVLPEPSSTFCVSLPNQFTALNTRVFLLFTTTNTAVELSGSLDKSVFCLSKAPIGYPVSVVVVAKTDQQYWFAETLQEIGIDTQLSLIPRPATPESIVALLKKF